MIKSIEVIRDRWTFAFWSGLNWCNRRLARRTNRLDSARFWTLVWRCEVIYHRGVLRGIRYLKNVFLLNRYLKIVIWWTFINWKVYCLLIIFTLTWIILLGNITTRRQLVALSYTKLIGSVHFEIRVKVLRARNLILKHNHDTYK